MNKQIEIDIDVYRHIEISRLNFEETPNTILRRLLGIDKKSFSPHDNFANQFFLKQAADKPQSASELSDEISKFHSRALIDRIQGSEFNTARDWIYGGARLSEGTNLQKWSGTQKHEAVIYNGSILINGQGYKSPSAAAMAVNGGTNVNGWLFWEYFDESTKQWEKLNKLRKTDTDE